MIKVAGGNATDRIMQSLDGRRFEGIPLPDKSQVAMVLHALADHTAIMEMLKHRPDPTTPWPEATSVGRWLHDVGDALEDEVFTANEKRKKYFHNHVCSTCSPDGINPGSGCHNCRNSGMDQSPCPNCSGKVVE